MLSIRRRFVFYSLVIIILVARHQFTEICTRVRTRVKYISECQLTATFGDNKNSSYRPLKAAFTGSNPVRATNINIKD